MLTADSTREELTGENAALAMFRANRQPVTPASDLGEPWLDDAHDLGTSVTSEFEPSEFEPSEFEPSEFEPFAFGPPASGPREFEPLAFGPPASGPGALGVPVPGGPRIPGPRSSGRPGRRVGLMAAAVTLAAAAGLAVAAYTEALPAPLQQAAYHVLGFAGVPAAHHSTPSATASHLPGSSRQHGTSPKPGHSQLPGAPASPQPSTSSPAPAGGPPGLSVTAASGRIVAGGSDTFVGHLSGHGGAVSGANLQLFERAAGQRTWSLAGTAKTGGNGSAVVTVSDLTTNAAFRLMGPDGALSRPVLVIVLPPVSASVSGSTAQADMVTASSPLAARGDTVVLQIQSGTRWLSVQMGRLNSASQARFLVRLRAKQRAYRVVLLPTASHGLSVSNAVMIPPR